MSSHEKSTAAPRLPVLGDGAGAAGIDAGTGLGTPRPIPRGVEVAPEGPVYFREWVVGPAGPRGWIAGAVLGAAFAAGGVLLVPLGGALAIGGGLLAALLGLAVLFTAVSFRGLAVRVDRDGIAWSFGPLLRRRYALDEVQMFRAREFAFRRRGGWGIGRAHDGVDVYQVWGANGTALDLVVKRAGITRHYLISTTAPDHLCTALVRANPPVNAVG